MFCCFCSNKADDKRQNREYKYRQTTVLKPMMASGGCSGDCDPNNGEDTDQKDRPQGFEYLALEQCDNNHDEVRDDK